MRLNFGGATLPALLLLMLLVGMLLGLPLLWVRRGRPPTLLRRSLRALDALRAALHHTAEMGETLHISPGIGTFVQGGRAAETLAGLEVASSVAEEAFSLGVPAIASTNDALVHIAAHQLLERAKERAGAPAELEARALWLAQQERMAYAAGALDLLSRPDVQANVLVGAFDEELLLLLDAGAREVRYQLLGAAAPAGVPFLPVSGEEFLLGEEIFVAGAYLRPRPGRLAGLAAQDVIRLVLLGLIVVGVVLVSLGGPGRLLQPLFWMPAP